ncbi:hypothetical protein Tco_0821297 [Tanacetum coccineum]|uniref:Retrovirus-related Pol polyprotein from transposon TNT 1-94 n=1 Tax=Tanacetum coccineum TaxID=301880 RepID=A0ABQ5ACU9_9ASTR
MIHFRGVHDEISSYESFPPGVDDMTPKELKKRSRNVAYQQLHNLSLQLRKQTISLDTYPILLSFTHCGNKSILRVLRIILVILPEHPSETIVFHNEDGNPARANIKQALGYLKDGDGDGNSQFLRCQAKPPEKHLKEVKRIFYADYTGCKYTFKSTSGGTKFLGEKLVSWSSKKQDSMALLITEAEYVSLSACCAQVLWMRTHLTDYGFYFNKIPIYFDSKSAIAISCNPVQHLRTKHIAVRYHFINEHVENGTIELYFVKTDYQLADLFTKALPLDRFNYLVRHLGMRSLSPQ